MRTKMLNHRKDRPIHPGALLRNEILPRFGVSQRQLSALLHVSRRTVNDLVAERYSVSVDLAYRLGCLFNMDASIWIRMQEAVDVWDALEYNTKLYKKILPLREPKPAVRKEQKPYTRLRLPTI